MRRLLLAILFALVAAHAVHAELGERHTEQAGGFSLRAPHGWQFREFPGLKYQIVFGPATDSFAPNINVVDEAFAGSLESYVEANMVALHRSFEDFILIRREAFMTTSGLKGVKLITTSKQHKALIRQTFFILPGSGGKYIVVTCSALAQRGESLDAVFDESVRTFELNPSLCGSCK